MPELVVMKVVPTEYEAEMVCSLLRTAGITCAHRPTNIGSGAADGMPIGGPRTILVHRHDLPTAVDVIPDVTPIL